MAQNPPERTQNIVPMVFYKDCPAAIAYIRDVFQFEELMSMPGPDGAIMHAELAMGNSVVMLNTVVDEDGQKGQADLAGRSSNVMVYVDDVDAHYAHVVANGSVAPMEEPEDQFWGDRTYRAEDPEGQRWLFATHVRDVAPEDMVPD